MLKPTLLAALLALGALTEAQAQAAPPPPPGPFPQEGIFCAPMKLCQPGLVTRRG